MIDLIQELSPYGFGEQPFGGVHIGQVDRRPVLADGIDQPLTKPISIPGGYGWIPAGSVMGKISESTGRLGMHIPYTQIAPAAALKTIPGAAYVVQDGAGTTSVVVSMLDSYKFAVGDHLAAADANTYDSSALDLGAITAIDRTTYSHIAVITVTNAFTSSYTVAQGAIVFIQTTTSAPFAAAVGILSGGVWTGIGEYAKGGQGSLIWGHATLYKGALYNYDSAAATALGGVDDGAVIYLK